MDIYASPGTKVKFNNYVFFELDRKNIASAGITSDSILTVKNIEVFDMDSYVCFNEVEGKFNTVCFDEIPPLKQKG